MRKPRQSGRTGGSAGPPPEYQRERAYLRRGKARTFSNSLSAKAATAVGVFFCAQRPQEATRRRRSGATGNWKAPRKPRKNGNLGAFLDGRNVQEWKRAARPRPGSHSSRPRRRGVAALDDSIAGRWEKRKGAQRNNATLER